MLVLQIVFHLLLWIRVGSTFTISFPITLQTWDMSDGFQAFSFH